MESSVKIGTHGVRTEDDRTRLADIFAANADIQSKAARASFCSYKSHMPNADSCGVPAELRFAYLTVIATVIKRTVVLVVDT